LDTLSQMLIAARVADAQTFAPVPPALSSGARPAEAPSAAAAACEGRGGAGGRGRDDGARAEADLRDQLREWGFLMSVCGNVCALLPVYICMNGGGGGVCGRVWVGEGAWKRDGREKDRERQRWRESVRVRARACVTRREKGRGGGQEERERVSERDVVLAFGFI